jgi:hypothetical protein
MNVVTGTFMGGMAIGWTIRRHFAGAASRQNKEVPVGKRFLQKSTTMALLAIWGIGLFTAQSLRAEGVSPLATASPAQWIDGTEAFDNELRCPPYLTDKGEDIAVFCQAELQESGEKKRSFCFTSSESHHRYSKATKRALRRVRYSPALVEGQPVAALVYASALFRQRGDQCEVSGFANWGVNAKSLGSKDYISPQEILTDGGWSGKIPYLLRELAFRARHGEGALLSIAADISADGVASNVQVANHYLELSQDDRKRIVDAYLDTAFIPGYIGGEPRAMQIREVFYLTASN